VGSRLRRQDRQQRAGRAAGVKFVPSPSRYYDRLPQHLARLGIERIDEELSALRELGILVDGRSPREYLLQVFTREAAALFDDRQAGPLFLEIIQRKGDRGFGAGNFRALFEGIEHQQEGHRP
jgi:4-hydroxyphenylpyruvate dioxygenase